MDGSRFDQLVMHLSRMRISRLTAVRGLVAGGLSAATGQTVLEEAGANNNKKKNRKPKKATVCVWSASGGTVQKVKKGKVGGLLSSNPCARQGDCVGTNPCVAGTPPPGSPGSSPPGCVPEPPETTCAGALCGTARNNTCGQAVACGCPSGQTCLANGTCARPCTSSGQCSGCTPQPATCTVDPSTDGLRLCHTPGQRCATLQPCDPVNSTGCPPGFACFNPCAPNEGHGCVAVSVCPAS
jgi:hypothetical protein